MHLLSNAIHGSQQPRQTTLNTTSRQPRSDMANVLPTPEPTIPKGQSMHQHAVTYLTMCSNSHSHHSNSTQHNTPSKPPFESKTTNLRRSMIRNPHAISIRGLHSQMPPKSNFNFHSLQCFASQFTFESLSSVQASANVSISSHLIFI